MWVNTPPLQRKSFYCDSLAEQRNVADIELKKIRCFTCILYFQLFACLSSVFMLFMCCSLVIVRLTKIVSF
jgi:hypothetical protein